MVVYIPLMWLCGLAFGGLDPILLTGTHDARFDWPSWNLKAFVPTLQIWELNKCSWDQLVEPIATYIRGVWYVERAI